jgi:CheY-specific phosphatase CheX
MNNNLNEAIVKGTAEIFDGMLGIDTVAGEIEKVPIESDGAGTSTIISFMGEVSGAFVFRCAKPVAAALAGEMLGMEIEEDSEDMKDSIGELLNMIVGSAKSHYSSNNAFTISVPTTVTGADYTFYIKADPSDTMCRIPFSVGAHQLTVDVYLKGS